MTKLFGKFNRGGHLALTLTICLLFAGAVSATWLYQEYTGTAENVEAPFTISGSSTHYIQVIAGTSAEIQSSMYCDQTDHLVTVLAVNGDCDRGSVVLPGPLCTTNSYMVVSDYATITGVNKLYVCDANKLSNVPNCTEN